MIGTLTTFKPKRDGKINFPFLFNSEVPYTSNSSRRTTIIIMTVSSVRLELTDIVRILTIPVNNNVRNMVK